jgi:hypothetical protein
MTIPFLSVVHGNPTEEELAAVTAVLLAMSRRPAATEPPRSRHVGWSHGHAHRSAAAWFHGHAYRSPVAWSAR